MVARGSTMHWEVNSYAVDAPKSEGTSLPLDGMNLAVHTGSNSRWFVLRVGWSFFRFIDAATDDRIGLRP